MKDFPQKVDTLIFFLKMPQCTIIILLFFSIPASNLYSVFLSLTASSQNALPIDHNPGPAMAALMKLSFDEEHRSAICHLGKGFLSIAHL